jgi:GT2 family glycosyltransferase
VLVYDGQSSDRSFKLAEAIASQHPGWAVLANERRIQAAAWNAGIRAARGAIVGIVSGHAELDPDYVRRAVEALEETGADMVGGPVRAVGAGLLGEAVAVATSSAFGVGGARHHYATERTDVDTVFMGVCRRETYLRFPFDETMVRNQDDELSYRLLDAGGRIVCDPAIRSRYRNRSTLPSLWRQYFDYGRWKVRVAQAHPRQIRPRHLAPAGLVAALVTAGALAPWSRPAAAGFGLLLGVYGSAVAAASLRSGGSRVELATALLAAYPTLHLAYGCGTLYGLWQFRDGWLMNVVGDRGAPEA